MQVYSLSCQALLLFLIPCHLVRRTIGSLASTPPMGYNTWNDLACMPDEGQFQNIATRLSELGFLSLGYKYLTVDDCWMSTERGTDGHLTADPAAFPSGMRYLADFVHNLGFMFGLYTSRGLYTCEGRPASMGYEKVDAKTFASWGVDFLKNDGCNDPDCHSGPRGGPCPASGRRKVQDKYAAMYAALNGTGRAILHSVCGWQPWFAPVGRHLGQMWRVGADVRDWQGVYEATRVMEQLAAFHGPGGWNDPDMLIGSSSSARLSLTPTQSRAQFSLWTVMAAPLMLGTSVLNMSEFDRETYSNAEAIRVNQDQLGRPGRVVLSNCPKYPQFRLGTALDEEPQFEAELENFALCGSHMAATCSECPNAYGPEGCGGDCMWVGTKGTCKERQVAVSCGTRMATSCAACSNGSGAAGCYGDCAWVSNSDESGHSGSCERRHDVPVSCGMHNATSCEECPMGHGETWCNGDCHWERSDGTCEQRYLMKPTWNESSDPWRYPVARLESQSQCQQVWAKPLYNGDVGVVAVNFASTGALVRLPLKLLGLNGRADCALFYDLWSQKSVGNRSKVVCGELSVELDPHGGHVLLRLIKSFMDDGGGRGSSSARDELFFDTSVNGVVVDTDAFKIVMWLSLVPVALLVARWARPRVFITG